MLHHNMFLIDERLQNEILKKAKEQNPAMQTG